MLKVARQNNIHSVSEINLPGAWLLRKFYSIALCIPSAYHFCVISTCTSNAHLQNLVGFL